MGEVWRAWDRSRDLPVAVKLLARDEDAGVSRFLREAVSLSQLDHPGIVRYVAHGEMSSGELYLAMEWLEGEDLSETLLRGPLTVDGTIVLLRQVAEALSVAHARGIVHRDIKPSNLFLPGGSIEAVKLVDFGVARIKNWTGTWTRNGWMLGTPAYMAPEQVRGDREIDAGADLFSLGCVAFECLTGRCPFGGVQVLAVLRSIMQDEAPSARELAPEVPRELDALIKQMMAKDRCDRPRDAAEIAAALSNFEVSPEIPNDTWRRSALTRGEQRIVTVLLVGGTDTSEVPPTTILERTEISPNEVDPTRNLGLLLKRTGAKLERFASESFILGLPPGGMPSDRAVQTARCALSLAGVLPGRPMALATGRREIGARTELGTRAEPEVVKRAARLLPTGTEPTAGSAPRIVVDDLTARLLGNRFEISRGERELELRGERPTRMARPAMGSFVGRERELSAVHGIFTECIDEPIARAVLVTAPAGAGKSRLRAELLEQLARDGRAQIWVARGDPLSAGSPFGLISQLMRDAAGISDGDSDDLQEHKLAARFARQADEAEAIDLGDLVRAPPPQALHGDQRTVRSSPPPKPEEPHRGWTDFLAAACEAGPVVLVLEDLHWGDLPSVKLLDSTLRDLRDAPLMVIAFARPEVHDLFPKLWVDRELEEIRLGALTKSAAGRLVQDALGDTLTSEARSKILDLAGGNPFYLEELMGAASEQRDAIPDTLLAMVHARLEKLDPEARRVLRAASIFGHTFWRGAVVALLGGAPTVADWLAELVEQKIVTKQSTSRFANEEEYVFCEPMVREGAYAMLTNADRALGHSLAAQWLEEMGEPDEAVITGHYKRAELRESA